MAIIDKFFYKNKAFLQTRGLRALGCELSTGRRARSGHVSCSDKMSTSVNSNFKSLLPLFYFPFTKTRFIFTHSQPKPLKRRCYLPQPYFFLFSFFFFLINKYIKAILIFFTVVVHRRLGGYGGVDRRPAHTKHSRLSRADSPIP